MSTSEKKELLMQAWKEIFEVEQVSEDADFFEDGGDSIKAVQLSSWLLQKGIKLDLGKIFYTPVLSQMAETLEETDPVYVPEEMVTKELIGSKIDGIMKNMDSGKVPDKAQNEQICDPQSMPQKTADQLNGQICDPQSMPQKTADQLNGQICDPQSMAQKAADQLNGQNCDPQSMAQKAADQLNGQICDPYGMPAGNRLTQAAILPYNQEYGTMISMFQTILQQQQVMLQMMQVMLTRMTPVVQNPFPAPFQGNARRPFPMKASKSFSEGKRINHKGQIPEAAKEALRRQMEKYQAHPVDKPIDKPNVIGIKPAKVTKPEYSAEEVLDHVLSGIFKDGYSKTEDLFEQGLTSLDTVKMVTRCGEHGYALSMQDIYMKSTFEELVACMKPGE
jgi:aryl carrier-like protein